MTGMIGWGIVGAGRVAHGFAEGLRSASGARLLGVASRTTANAERMAQRFSVPRVHATVAALVADPEIDVVYVASPNPQHHGHCIAALEGHKAVLCEKPFASNADQARRVIALARERRLFCMEAMWMRFLPAMDRLRALLSAGAIGEVRMVTANFGFAAPYLPENRFFNPALGGGAFADVGIYPLSLAVHLLGSPARIIGTAAVGPTGVDEQSVAVLSYPAGELAVLSASLRSDLPTDAVLTGTRGEIRIAPLFRPERLSLRTFSEAAPASPTPEAGLLRGRLKAIAPLRAAYGRAKRVAQALLRRPPMDGVLVEHVPFKGNGYNYEAEEVMRCMRAGETESKLMPLEETLTIMECLDTIHGQWRQPLREA